jgi:hypothetical protein
MSLYARNTTQMLRPNEGMNKKRSAKEEPIRTKDGNQIEQQSKYHRILPGNIPDNVVKHINVQDEGNPETQIRKPYRLYLVERVIANQGIGKNKKAQILPKQHQYCGESVQKACMRNKKIVEH